MGGSGVAVAEAIALEGAGADRSDAVAAASRDDAEGGGDWNAMSSPRPIATTPLTANTTRDMAILRAQPMPAERTAFLSRRERASGALRERGLAAMLLAPGSDLAYLSGYRIFSSERLTCLVLTASGEATLVLPELESPRAKVAAPELAQRTWGETEDP